jgi:hypothetical protein
MDFLNDLIGGWVASFRSKRTQAAAVGLATIGWQIYTLVKSGQPVPAELVLSFFGILGLWIKTDGERPTAPKPTPKPDEVAS